MEGARHWFILSSIIVLLVLIGLVLWLIFTGPIDSEELAKVPGAPSISEVRSLVQVKERVYPKVDPDDLLRRWRRGMETYHTEMRVISLQSENDALTAILDALEEELEEVTGMYLELEGVFDALSSYLEGVAYV